MMGTLSYAVAPGGLSSEDHDRIFEMAERGMKSGPIARALSKHPATVRWFMYRHGLMSVSKRSSMPTAAPNRAGRKGYTPEEDAFITALRIQRYTLDTIAEMATKRFGHPRSRHGIDVRLTMLATAEDDQ